MSVFASNAFAMWCAGLAVLPIRPDRQPSVSGFNRWSRRPGKGTLANWMRDFPDDNIAILPGLSGVVVVDCDDTDQDEEVERLFGNTPISVVSRRGRHRYYMACHCSWPGNLRAFGLDVDIKAGRSLVIAPPSRHESGHIYLLEGDWSDIKRLPPINAENLRERLSRPLAGGRPDRRFMRDGSRGQWLNDRLCARATSCGSFDALLLEAKALNSQLEPDPLDDAEVFKRAGKVWQDAQAGKLRPPSASRTRTAISALDRLCRLSSRLGPDAMALLLMLQAQHTARCRRGETFAITPRAMADHEVIPGWPRERYERARDLLLEAGLVVLVSPHIRKGRKAAQYALVDAYAQFQEASHGGRAVNWLH